MACEKPIPECGQRIDITGSQWPILSALVLSLLAGVVLFLISGSQVPVYQGKPVRLWIQDLASADYQIRDQAVAAIRAVGPQARPFLIRALRPQNSLTEALSRLSRRAPFLHLTTSANADLLREKAAEELGLMAQNDGAALDALISSLTEKNPDVLFQVQRALRRIGPQSVPALVGALQSRRSIIRQRAAEVLIDLGVEARAGVPALLLALQDPEREVRRRAAQAFGRILESDAKIINALKVTLDDPTPAVRGAAAEALGRIGPNARAAVQSLHQRLGDSDTGVRIDAARALWQIEDNTEQVVPVLIEALKDGTVGWQVPLVLAAMGPKAGQAVPGLIEALKRERVSRPLRSPPSSAFALGQIGPVAVPELRKILRDERPFVRTSAAIALGFIGSGAHPAVPALIPLLKDKDLEVRQASALSLGAIAPQTKELAPALAELTHDEDIFVSSAAASALKILTTSSGVLPSAE